MTELSKVLETIDAVGNRIKSVEDSLTAANQKTDMAILDLSQKMTSFGTMGSKGSMATKSFGDQVAEGYKAQESVFENTKHISIKSAGAAPAFLTSANGSSVSGGVIGQAASVVYGMQNALSLATFTDHTQVYARFNNDNVTIKGSIVQEKQGDLKAEIDVDLQQITQNAIQIATWSSLSRQLFKDQKQISSIIETAHRRQLVLAMDKILVQGFKGATAADSFEGYAALATPFSKAGATLWDSVSYCQDQMFQDGFNPQVVVMNPADAIAGRLAVDKNNRPLGDNYLTSAEGNFVRGIPLVVSPNVTAGTAILLDRAHSVLNIIDELNANIYVQGQDVVKNLVTLLTESRFLPTYLSTNSARLISVSASK